MSASVFVALACAVLAAVGAGVLVARSIRMPRMDIPAWACTMAGLAVALGAQAIGTSHGYGSGTFRAVQFGAQLIAPLWLAWGLTELTAKSGAVRFGAKLVTMALTVVTGVVLLTDPLSSTPFSTSWPAASAHYQIIPRSLLSLIAGVTLATVVVALTFAVVRLQTDPAWRRAVIPICAAGTGAAAVLGLRLALPNAAYLALCVACAALTWFAGGWADKIGLAELHGEVRPQRADRRDRRVAASLGESESGDDESFGDHEQGVQNGGHRQFGDGDEYDDWYRPATGNQANSRYPSGEGYQHNGGIAMNGLHQGERRYEPDDADQGGAQWPRTFGGDAGLGDAGLGDNGRGDDGLGAGRAGFGGADDGLGAGRAGFGGDDDGLGAGRAGFGGDDSGLGGVRTGFGGDDGLGADSNGFGGDDDGLGAGRAGFGGDDSGLGAGRAGFGGDDSGLGGVRTGFGGDDGLGAGSNGFGGDDGLGAGSAAHVPAAAAPAGPADGAAIDQTATQRLYGLIAIYTLAEGAAAEFDALAERVVEEVRSSEPDALVYAVHSVPNAEMQRIFYEVYRDRMAYEDHQRLPHVQRFASARGPYVLATNVIELGTQQAKLSPLSVLSTLFGPAPGA